MSETSDCIVHSDCTTFDEETNQEIFKACYVDGTGNNTGGHCDCSSSYGFVGDRCDEPSAHTYSLMSWLLLATVWAVILATLLLRDMINHVNFKRFMWKLNTKSIDTVLSIMLFSMFGLVFALLHNALVLRGLFHPHSFTIVYFPLFNPSHEEVQVTGGYFVEIFSLYSWSCFVLASMQISLSWIDVANCIVQFTDERQRVRSNMFKKFIKAVTFVHIFLGIILVPLGYLIIYSLHLVIQTLFLAILFLLGRRRLMERIRLLRKSQQGSMLKTIQIVRFSSKLHVVFLVLLSAVVILFIFSGMSEGVGPGEFNPAVFVRALAMAIGLVISSTNVHYTRVISRQFRQIGAYQVGRKKRSANVLPKVLQPVVRSTDHDC